MNPTKFRLSYFPLYFANRKTPAASALLLTFLLSGVAIVLPCVSADGATYRIADEIEIDAVPSWFPVGFCLLTHEENQYAAYYNQDHRMIVARRQLPQRTWQKVELPTKIGWDSHNYITMAIDSDGNLHLAGNMHCVPLIYFRTQKPGDINTFERLPMTGEEEQRCTYPVFMQDADDHLLFMYRSGSSGNGRRFFNRYDPATLTWSRFLDTPLCEGDGLRNAYPMGPQKGPDGRFHVVWVWRETPDCATNHHLSYARSHDMRNWETAAGQAVALPFRLEQQQLWVDPIPVGGGIINGCESLSFDSQNRPVIAYHKSDDNGHMQIFVARYQDQQWKRQAITAWDKKISFGGGGAMPFIGIKISDLQRLEPDKFYINYRHRDYGSGRFVLDETTLKPIQDPLSILSETPSELSKPTIDFDGIGVRMAFDRATPPDAKVRYLLRWEALGPNHDRPRDPPLPPASSLKLIKLERLP